MKITLKNYEIINAVNSLKELLQLDNLSTKVNWNLSKNFKLLLNSHEIFNECEANLLNKYVLRDDENKIRQDENGNPKFSPKMHNEYLIEHNELLQCEDNVNILTIKLSDFPDNIGRGMNLFNLDFMIEQDNE